METEPPMQAAAEKRHKILVIDDEPAMLDFCAELLAQLPSRPEVVTTTSGARGLTMLKTEPFRLLLCDLKMPKMDGLQVLSIVRRRCPELRTVVFTGVQNDEFRSRAYALGVDLFWLKPDIQQNLDMFLQCLESLLNQQSEGSFRGLQSKALVDIIQMESLAQSSTVLRITHGALVGRLWLQAGELIDAETEGMRGENAFRRILRWKSGTFENLPADPGRERTIAKPVNALLLETAQAIDEQTRPGDSPEEAEQAEHRKTVWRLAALTRADAEFVVSVPKENAGPPEGWGTESASELAQWMRQATAVCQELSQTLQAGPLSHLEARSVDYRLVLLPQEQKDFLVGWSANTEASGLADHAKQLVASWDS